jgi:hypothetical protein
VIGWGGAYAAPQVQPESDEEFRKRLLYVAGDGAAAVQRIHMARGAELDAIAGTYGLKRRTT